MHFLLKPFFNQSPVSLPLWALINVGSLLAMYGAHKLWPSGTGDYVLFAYALFLLGPPCAAGLLDGRLRSLSTLVVSAWSVLIAALVILVQTEAWRRDCGLGQAFTFYFAGIAALAYPVAAGVVFGVGKALSAGFDWLSELD